MYRRVAGGGSYIDGFAGTGLIRVDGETRSGSARIALASAAFARLFLFELPPVAAKLDRNLRLWVPYKTRRRCSIHPGDFNAVLPQVLASGEIPRAKPCFAFLDPNSTHLPWSSVTALAGFKGGEGGGLKVELWVLLNTYQALVRLLPHDPPAK
jgi:three-Cys-motif partner protein